MSESGELRMRKSAEAVPAPAACKAPKDTFHGPVEKFPKQLMIAVGALEGLLLLGTIINLVW